MCVRARARPDASLCSAVAVSHINLPSFETPRTKEWAVAQITACQARHRHSDRHTRDGRSSRSRRARASQGDYGYYSHWSSLLSIGLNNQTLHHLFPSVHAAHYPALSELVKPVLIKHGVGDPIRILSGRGWGGPIDPVWPARVHPSVGRSPQQSRA